MSDAQEDLRKMQLLLRLRQLERNKQAAVHQLNEQAHTRSQQDYSRCKAHYEAAHTVVGQFNPDAHIFRLGAIDGLRLQTTAADERLRHANDARTQSRLALAYKELETRLAEQSKDAAMQALMQQQEKMEYEEALDLQLFRRVRRS